MFMDLFSASEYQNDREKFNLEMPALDIPTIPAF